MWMKCKNFKAGNYRGVFYMGHIKNCKNCSLRSKCIRNEKTKARQVAKFDLTKLERKESFTAKMIRRFDTPEGRSIYGKTAWSEAVLPARLCNLNGYSRTSIWTFEGNPSSGPVYFEK